MKTKHIKTVLRGILISNNTDIVAKYTEYIYYRRSNDVRDIEDDTPTDLSTFLHESNTVSCGRSCGQKCGVLSSKLHHVTLLYMMKNPQTLGHVFNEKMMAHDDI